MEQNNRLTSLSLLGLGGLKRKRVVYISLDEKNPELLSEALSTHWQVTTLNYSEALQSPLAKHVLHVVLLRFPATIQPQVLERAEQLLSQHDKNILWIAIVPSQWQQSEELCELVTRNFYDYHQLPADKARLDIVIGHAFGMLEVQSSTQSLERHDMALDTVMGSSQAITTARQFAKKAAATESAVLLAGENGVGKKLFAQMMHQRSRRQDGPLEFLNLSALSTDSMEEELFGYERNATDGPALIRPGRLELAQGGSLVLEEIAALTLPMQARLLQALKSGVIQRAGSKQDVKIDVRVMFTNKEELGPALAKGHIREDFYHHINALKLLIPPLRERREDIELLARSTLQQLLSTQKSGPRDLTRQALQAMLHYRWPGNVRELQNRVQQAFFMAQGKMITPKDLGIERRRATRRIVTLEEARNEAEKKAITNALYAHKHNVTRAAADLGVSRITLYRLMDKLNISHGQ